MIRRSDRNRVIALAVLVVAVILALVGLFTPVSGALQAVTARLAAPFHAAGNWLERRSSAEPPAVQALQTQLDELLVQNAQLRSLKKENDSLKAALEFREAEGDDSVAARVIYEVDDGVSRLLVLDRGQADGLAVGQPVVAGKGVIIGKIVSVRRKTAKVMPLTDARSRLAVTVQNQTETLGVLEGDRGLSLVMRLVPQTEDLSVDQTVITSGLEPGIRRGLVVGVVDEVDRPPRQPFQSATVRPFSEWRHPLLVQVLVAATDEAAL
jgi:rod shape-determining protein MreC